MSSIKEQEEWRDAKRQRNTEFLSLSPEEQAATIKHGTQCHRWMNFIPPAVMATLDQNNPDEIARWNRIFHYQRHPFHRPPQPVGTTLTGQRVLVPHKPMLVGQIICDIDTSDDPTVGRMVREDGIYIWCELIDAYEHIWQVIS